jgi:cysteinylglycine-S-conjugate dipeptidase
MARPELAVKIDGLMGALAADLSRLSRLPSGSACAGPARRLVPRAHDLLVELLRAAGVQRIRDLTRTDGRPVVAGSIPPPGPEAPTVLLYADYDVRTPGESATPDPLLVHLGALRAFDGRPPVGVEIVFEGQESPLAGPDAQAEAAAGHDGAAPLTPLTPQHPEEVACDAMVYHPRTAAGLVPACRDARAELSRLRGAVLAEARFLEDYAADFTRVSP